MELNPLENLLWGLGIGLKVLLCALVFYRRLDRRLPFFSLYVVLLVAKGMAVWWAYRQWGFTSHAYAYTFWSAFTVVVLARGLAVAELCWTSMTKHPAVWLVVRRVLYIIGAAVLVYAAATSFAHRSPVAAFLYATERGLDISIMVIVVALLGLGLRFEVGLGPIGRDIALGIGLFSASQVVLNAFMNERLIRYYHWWTTANLVAFDLALVFWIIPLRKPLPAPTPAPELISERVAVHLLRQLLARMRAITEELKRISRTKRK
jgi:hypothetical protein